MITARTCACGNMFVTRLKPRKDGLRGYEHRHCLVCAAKSRAKVDDWLAGLRAETLHRHEGRTCAFCGEPVAATRDGKTRYCSRLCAQRAWRGQQPGPELLAKVCELARCRKPFETRYAIQRFCSEKCEQRARKVIQLAKLRAATRARLGDDKPCDVCGRYFTPRDRRHRFCTNTCSRIFHGPRVSTLIMTVPV